MVTTPEHSGAPLTLDEALTALRQDMTDAASQSKFYDLFLNTPFCVPTIDPKELEGELEMDDGDVLPLVITAEGNDYLMIFDSEERLKIWAGTEIPWVPVPGHVIASTTMPPLHIAMNVGTDFSKQFLPDEIAWLRGVVEKCNQTATAQGGRPDTPDP